MTEGKIAEGLIQIGAMSEEQVQDVLRRQREGNDSFFGIMAMELGYVDEQSSSAMWSQGASEAESS